MLRRLTAALAAAAALALLVTATASARGFTIRAEITITRGHRLAPPVIALPNHTQLRLTVDNGGRRAHTVTVDGRRIRLGAGHRRLLDLRGLTTGHYPVSIDGHQRGHLTVGAAGGP